MTDGSSAKTQVEIDPVSFSSQTAELVMRASLPDTVLRPGHFVSFVEVTKALFNEAWLNVEIAIRRVGLNHERIQSVREAVALACWNQIVADLDWAVELVAIKEN